MRRSELDPVGARLEQRARVLDDARRFPRERKAVEQVVGNLVSLGQLDRRVVRGDDREVQRDLAPRALTRARIVLVDDGDRADHELRVAVAEPLLHQPHHVGVRRAAELQLVGMLCGERGQARRPRPDQERHARAQRLVGEHVPGGEAEELALEARIVAGEQAADDLPRFGDRRQRAHVLEADAVEPRPGGEPEVGAALRRDVERRGLPGDLDRVQRERVQARRPDAHALGRLCDLEQRGQRGLEEEIVEDRDDVEAVALRLLRERGVGARALVALQPETEARQAHVRSEVGIVRRPIRSIRMIVRSSGSGQATKLSCSSQSPAASCRCFAGSSGRTELSA